MALRTGELMWLCVLLYELGFIYIGPMMLHSDSTSAWQIDEDSVPHEHTKHFEVDIHFVREKI